MRTRTFRSRPTLVAAASLALLVVVAASGGVARAAIVDDNGAPPNWTLMFANPGPDAASDVVMTPTLTWVCGQSDTGDHGSDATLIRIVNATSVNTTHSYDGPAHLNDTAAALAVRGSWVYTGGMTRPTTDNLDLLVVRWTPAGAVKWARRYNSGGKVTDLCDDVGVDGKGNVIVCGTRDVSAKQDWVVVSWSPSGKRRWTWTYTGPIDGSDSVDEMYVDPAGNTYVTGISWVGPSTYACVTVKLSPAGKRLWIKRYAGAAGLGASGLAIARCPAGGVYVGGYEETTASGADALLLRYTAKGTRTVYDAWDGGAIGGSRPQVVTAIAVTTTGKIVGVGSHTDAATNDPLRVVWNRDGSIDGGVIELTPSPYNDSWVDVAADGAGGYCMTGTWPNAPSDLSIRTRRLSTWFEGGEWGYVWDGPVDTDYNLPRAVAANGTCYAVVGSYLAPGDDQNQFVQFWRY